MTSVVLDELPASSAPPLCATGPACVLLNPRSFRMSRGAVAGQLRAAATRCGAELVEADGPGGFSTALDDFLGRQPRLLAVLGGDGTLQAVVSHLARRGEQLPRPPLLVLGGGRTNLTAADLGGVGGTLAQRLERALLSPEAAFETVARRTLRVRQDDHLDEHGFFMAGALVDGVIRQCHRRQESGPGLFRAGPLGTAGRLVQLAARGLVGRLNMPAPRCTLESRALGGLQGPLRLLLATTLDHAGWFNPYAPRGAGPVRLTAVLEGAPGFWRNLPGLLRGRFGDRLNSDSGYLSGRAESIDITGLPSITLDGQEYDIDPTRPLWLEAGPTIQFLRA